MTRERDPGLVASAFRRGSVRVAIGVLFFLLAAAALAPLVANDLPIALRRASGWSFPALGALGRQDLLWAAALLFACGAFARRLRIVLAAAGGALVLYAAVWHEPRMDAAMRGPAEASVAAFVTGPKNTDLASRYSGIGASEHPLGTDELGRDVLARLLFGLRVSLLVGFGATALAMAVGITLGAWAGSGRRLPDALASWAILTSFCLPAVFVVAAVQSAGPLPLEGIVALLALLRFGPVARLVRQECMRVRGHAFVLAARGLGLHPVRVFLLHVLPNALAPATVAAAFGVAGAILAEAGLSFLGLGVPEPLPSLGRMLNDGRRAAPLAPHLVFLPGAALLVLILACHRIGAALRDAVDPRGTEATV